MAYKTILNSERSKSFYQAPVGKYMSLATDCRIVGCQADSLIKKNHLIISGDILSGQFPSVWQCSLYVSKVSAINPLL